MLADGHSASAHNQRREFGIHKCVPFTFTVGGVLQLANARGVGVFRRLRSLATIRYRAPDNQPTRTVRRFVDFSLCWRHSIVVSSVV